MTHPCEYLRIEDERLVRIDNETEMGWKEKMRYTLSSARGRCTWSISRITSPVCIDEERCAHNSHGDKFLPRSATIITSSDLVNKVIFAAGSQNYGRIWYKWPLTHSQLREIGRKYIPPWLPGGVLDTMYPCSVYAILLEYN